MNKSLYEITQGYLNVLQNLQIDEETGEILNLTTLDDVSGELTEKTEAVALYIKETIAFAEAIKQEETVLANRRKTLENKAERLKAYLKVCLENAGFEKVETAKTVVSFRNSVSVHIENEKMLPKEYVTIEQKIKADKTAIRKAIQSGVEIKGASLITNRNLQIK